MPDKPDKHDKLAKRMEQADLMPDQGNIRDAQETADDAIILKRYKIVQMIGSGNYSRVYKCLTSTGKEIAIKAINLAKNSENYTKKFLPRELGVLKKISHMNICKTHEIIQIQDRIYILMPYCQRGTIADLLLKTGPLSENVSRNLFSQVLDAIVYLHSIEIAHRDVKVENILLTNEFVPKLTDFSYSTFTGCPKNLTSKTSNGSPTNTTHKSSPNTQNNNNNTDQDNDNSNSSRNTQNQQDQQQTINQNQAQNQNTTQTNAPGEKKSRNDSPKSARVAAGMYHRQSALIKTMMSNNREIKLNDTFCGTLPYLAPEVIRLSSYDAKKVDVWSLGVCLFVMMNDKLPFGFNDLKKMVKKQASRDYKFRPGHEPSDQLKDLMSLMFEPEFTRRVEARELSRHSWLVGPMEKPNIT